MKIVSNVSQSTVVAGDKNYRLWGLRKSELLVLLTVLLSANALISKIATAIFRDGWVYALANTFEVSVIVWLGIFFAVSYASRVDGGPITFSDRIVAYAIVLLCFLPLSPVTWPFVTLASLYFYINAPTRDSNQAKSALIFAAVTVPMFWSRQIFSVFSDKFLALDASIVSQITGTERISNIVAMPGGSGYLQIAAPCSSIANVSLALLCWMIFTQINNLRWASRLQWCLVACAAVVAINVVRISLIGYFPQYYDLLHGPLGNTVVSWISLLTIVTICIYGTRHVSR